MFWILAVDYLWLLTRSAQLTTWLRRRAAPVHRHPASLQLSIHYLPVRRVDCQLDCLGVWQKRHAQTPRAPPNSALAYQGAPAYVPAALLYKAILAFSPAVSRAGLPDCIPVGVLVRDAAVLEPLR